MKSFILATFLFAASVVAQTPPVSVTQPLTAFTWTTCQPQIIAWTNANVATIPEIWLAQGNTTALQKILLIAQNVPTASGSFSWTPPSSITSGQYSLEIGTNPNIAYAGPFTINQAGSCTATASIGSAAAPGSSSAAAPPASSAAATSAAAPPASSAATSAAASSAASSAASAPATTTATKSAGSSIAPAIAAFAMIPLVAAALF